MSAGRSFRIEAAKHFRLADITRRLSAPCRGLVSAVKSAMGTISRRRLIGIAASLAAGSRVATRASALQDADRPRRPASLVAERVPERYQSLPFEAQQLGGILADRMRVNVEG